MRFRWPEVSETALPGAPSLGNHVCEIVERSLSPNGAFVPGLFRLILSASIHVRTSPVSAGAFLLP